LASARYQRRRTSELLLARIDVMVDQPWTRSALRNRKAIHAKAGCGAENRLMAFDTPNRTSHSTRLFALDIAQGRQARDNADEALRVGMARRGEHLCVLSILFADRRAGLTGAPEVHGKLGLRAGLSQSKSCSNLLK
jgi:hypothetical protein